jgi:hypothetical protein
MQAQNGDDAGLIELRPPESQRESLMRYFA